MTTGLDATAGRIIQRADTRAEWVEDRPDRAYLHGLLADEPDDCIIHGAFAEPLSDSPHTTWSDTRDEMLGMLAATGAARGWVLDWPEACRQSDHEGEHAAAAFMVGMTVVRFGFALWDEGRTSRWQFAATFAAPSRPVTKLAYASIVAAPARLSMGDGRAITELGYRDVRDVSDRVSTFNAVSAAGGQLPVPASCLDSGSS